MALLYIHNEHAVAYAFIEIGNISSSSKVVPSLAGHACFVICCVVYNCNICNRAGVSLRSSQYYQIDCVTDDARHSSTLNQLCLTLLSHVHSQHLQLVLSKLLLDPLPHCTCITAASLSQHLTSHARQNRICNATLKHFIVIANVHDLGAVGTFAVAFYSRQAGCFHVLSARSNKQAVHAQPQKHLSSA